MDRLQVVIPESNDIGRTLTAIHSLVDRSSKNGSNFEIVLIVGESEERTLSHIHELPEDERVSYAITRQDPYVALNKLAREYEYDYLMIWPENAFMDGMEWNAQLKLQSEKPMVQMFRGNIGVPILNKALVQKLSHVSAANNIVAYVTAYAHASGILTVNNIPVSSQDGNDSATEPSDMETYSVQRCLLNDIALLKEAK